MEKSIDFEGGVREGGGPLPHYPTVTLLGVLYCKDHGIKTASPPPLSLSFVSQPSHPLQYLLYCTVYYYASHAKSRDAVCTYSNSSKGTFVGLHSMFAFYNGIFGIKYLFLVRSIFFANFNVHYGGFKYRYVWNVLLK